MTEPKRLKVFLCHAHSDATAVHDLFHYLRREGVDVWLDKESLLPGTDWEFEIHKAVRASDVVVVCLSKRFNRAGFRQKEVRIALDIALEKLEGEIFIIPARLEECETPENLSKWHWVDLFEEGGRQKLIQALRVRAANTGASLDSPTGQQSGVVSQPGTPPGIWIDHKGYVWRDSTKLGKLEITEYHKLLVYLIAHKNKVCSYSELYDAASFDNNIDTSYPEDVLFNVTFSKFSVRLNVDRGVSSIKQLIEVDPQRPFFISKERDGYVLRG